MMFAVSGIVLAFNGADHLMVGVFVAAATGSGVTGLFERSKEN